MNLKAFMEIFLNHYRNAEQILRKVIQKMLLAYIVYATTRLVDSTCWENHITLCKTMKICGIHSGCHNKNFYGFAASNVKISLNVTCIDVESELDNPNDIFFQPVKKIDKHRRTIGG